MCIRDGPHDREAHAHARRVLLADQPTGELDQATAAGVLDLLAELRDLKAPRS